MTSPAALRLISTYALQVPIDTYTAPLHLCKVGLGLWSNPNRPCKDDQQPPAASQFPTLSEVSGVFRVRLMNWVAGVFDRTLVVPAPPNLSLSPDVWKGVPPRRAHAAGPPAERKLRWVHQTTAACDEAGGPQALEL